MSTDEMQVEEQPEVEPQEQDAAEVETEDSAPSPADDPGEPEPKKDRVQERINQITAEKYAEKRRADELERRLKEFDKPKESEPAIKPPRLEDFDYDDERFYQANTEYVRQLAQQEAANAFQSIKQREQAETESKRQNDMIVQHMVRVDQFSAEHKDFSDVAARIPNLPDQTLLAIMAADNSPEIVYHLGSNQDLADKLASSDPITAARMIGRLEAQLSSSPPKKNISKAPDPIEPIRGGSAVDVDEDKLSTDEWIARRRKQVMGRNS